MWFGGPRQALQADVGSTRSQNDALIALALKYPKMVPVATVHPYDGQAALDELTRVARRVRVLKRHPHTQTFDTADLRVLKLVQQAGTLGVVVLMDNAGIVAGDSEDLFNLAVSAPKTKFIFAHIGGASTFPARSSSPPTALSNRSWSGRSAMSASIRYSWAPIPRSSRSRKRSTRLERLDRDEHQKARNRYGNARALLQPR